MKTFREYITEANPIVDKNRRSEALHVFNRILVTLEKLVKSKSTDHMYFDMNPNGRTFDLKIDVGDFINDSRYKGLKLLFTSVTKAYGGTYGMHKGKPTIELAIMSGRRVRDPNYKMTNTSYDDLNGWIYSDPFVKIKDPSNYEHLLATAKTKREQFKDIFVHEFIHYTDTFLYKDKAYVDKGTYDDKTGYGEKYFNHPKELNAHTQEMIQNIDEWMKAYYVSAVATLRSTFVKKFNEAKTADQYEDVSFLAYKFSNYYNVIDEYLSNKQKAIANIRDKIPSSKTNFAKNLTQDSTRKVLVRLYQYYDDVLSKRFKTLKATLDSLPKQLNNKEAALYIKQHDLDAYKTLKRLGMK